MKNTNIALIAAALLAMTFIGSQGLKYLGNDSIERPQYKVIDTFGK